IGVLTRMMVPLRGALLGAFTSPGTAISALSKSIGGLALRLTGIPALLGIVKGGIAALGGGLSMLLSPIGLVGAAFVAAGVLIWKYWGPIKAFFSGFFTGVIQGLAPVYNAFSRLAPVFGVIGDGVKNVWNWFKKVLTPVEESREVLNKCASAGQIFGEVLGTALSVL
ncbi:phage tail tape measure protein, partial [Klebsiella pneumoniae]